MAKTNNAQVQHVFAQGNRGDARAENTHCVDDRLYSYSTPIAKWHDVSRGRRAVLITSDGYSPITRSKHLSGLASALIGMYMYVPYVGENGGRAPLAADMKAVHRGNVEYLLGKYAEVKVRETKRRSGPEIHDMAAAADAVNTYCDWFGLKAPRLTVDLDFIALKEAYETRNTPEQKAKRKADKLRRERIAAEKESARLKALEGELNDWRAGKNIHFGRNVPVMFRLKGDDTVQTSMGAEVPLKHAVRVFKFVKWVRMSGQRWQRNGHRVPVGHFEIDAIEPNGDFKAGCHSITWAEVERFARQIGVYEEAASIAAEIQTAEQSRLTNY